MLQKNNCALYVSAVIKLHNHLQSCQMSVNARQILCIILGFGIRITDPHCVQTINLGKLRKYKKEKKSNIIIKHFK